MSSTSRSEAVGSTTRNETTSATSALRIDASHHVDLFEGEQPQSAVSFHIHRGRLGCAVFSEEEQQLLLCEDMPCDCIFDQQEPPSLARNGDNDADLRSQDAARKDAEGAGVTHSASASVFESLLAQFRPGIIIASSTCPRPLISVLQTFSEQRGSSVEIRQAKEFQLALGLAVIAEATAYSGAVDVDDASNNAGHLDAGMLSGYVLLDAKISISKASLSIAAVGPLMSVLRSQRDIGRSLLLVSLSLDDYMFVDENTLRSLSICSSDQHAFVHAKAGREGFTVLAMLNLIYSKASFPLLRRWVMLPLANRAEIQRRHDAVETLLRQETFSEVIEIRARLAELGKLPQICHLLNMGLGSASLWDRLRKTCHAVLRIRIELNALDLRSSEMVREIRDQLQAEPLVKLGDKIEQMIDFDESKNEGKITIRAGVDGHLDELRERCAGLPAFLDQIATELKGEPAFRSITSLNVVYFPQIGYLIVAPQAETVASEYDNTLEHQFASEEAVYLKNSRMTTMDQRLGDVASFIVDREIELLDGLHEVLDESIAALLAAHTSLCQLDCLMAFARAATLYDLRRPHMVEEQVIKLKGSRHALKALSDESFVPNDLYLRGGCAMEADLVEAQSGRDQDPDGSPADRQESNGIEGAPERASQDPARPDGKHSVMVLTGANSSGKSCLLQQAALAVFLSQCGCFVPATRAELGVFDKILTRMRQDESVTSEGSSFTRELGRLHRAISMSTARSLVILDEVGRECRSDDGAGLFIATIYDFLQRGRECPIVVSATHHLRAIERHFPDSLPIERAHMQTILLPTLAETFNSLTYLYRLKPGFAGTSHACHCARLCGVPESVVELADRICRVGLRAWHDSEAVQDEIIVRRLLELDLDTGEDQVSDAEARRLLEWILQPSSSSSVAQQ